MLAFLAALNQIADADIKLRLILEIVGAELARAEKRKELRVPRQVRVRTQVRRHFFGFILQNGRARRLHRADVLQRQSNRLVESYFRRRIRARRWSRSGRRRWGQWWHLLPLAHSQGRQCQKHRGPRQSFLHGETSCLAKRQTETSEWSYNE